MSEDTARSVRIERTSVGRYVVHNVRGGSIPVGAGGADATFTPVELLLAAIGGCTAADVDLITSRRAEPARFVVDVTGDKVRDAGGNRMQNLTVVVTATFPDGAAGDRAREALPRSLKQSHDRLCTVSRTVELGTPVTTVEGEPSGR
jgi:putative redox protein